MVLAVRGLESRSNVQPTGTSRTHGSHCALGTDCAIDGPPAAESDPGSQCGSPAASPTTTGPVAQPAGQRDQRQRRHSSARRLHSGLPSRPRDEVRGQHGGHDHGQQQPDPADAPALDPDRRRPGGQQAEELGVQVAALGADHPAQLGGQGQPAGGGERLGDLVDGELPQRPLVDLFGRWTAAPGTSIMLARSTAWRHGRRAELGEATSMSSSRPSRTSRLAGLMSRWARPASHSLRTMRRPSSMMRVVDLGLAELDGAVEELGDQQVLPLRGELDEAVRLRAGQPGRAASARSA